MTIQTRYEVCREEVLYPTDWIYSKESLTVLADGIPAFIGYDFRKPSIGYAYDFQRDSNTLGISFEVRVNEAELAIYPGLADLGLSHWDKSFYATNVIDIEEEIDGRKVQRLISAVIKAFVFVPLPIFPEGLINNE